MTTHVVITTAVDVSPAQKTQIQKAVQAKYGADVEYAYVVDTSIVGGIRISINSKELDGSIKSRLNDVKVKLHAAAMK